MSDEKDPFELPSLKDLPKTGEVTLTVDWDRVALLMLHATKALVWSKQAVEGLEDEHIKDRISLGKDAISALTEYLMQKAGLMAEEEECTDQSAEGK